MKPHIGTLVALLGIVVAASLPAEPRRAITQGEFAVLLVQFLKLEPEREWTAKHAVETLESSGIEPNSGWSSDEPLTESVLVELIRPAQMPVLTPDPERQVTRLEAMAVFHRMQNLYSRSFVPNRTPSGIPLTGIEGAKGHPATGGGPAE
jgi:hypothetical protein